MKKKCCHVRMLSPNKSCSKDNLDGVIDVQQYNPLIHQQLGESKIQAAIACVASVSARVCLESQDKSPKKKRNDGGGGGGGERRKRLPTNPTILKNCVRPRTQLLIGAVRVVLITQHSKHQSNQVCFVFVRHRSGLI